MKKYDVFISYAFEDVDAVASGIVAGLRSKGLDVYFVHEELGPGDSVLETVYRGLESSKFCVAVLSPDYVRTWPLIEQHYVLHWEKKLNRRLLFPVRHRLTHQQTTANFPALHDHYSISTEEGLDTVVEKLHVQILERKREFQIDNWKKAAVSLCFLILASVAAINLVPSGPSALPPPRIVESLIRQRIATFQQEVELRLAQRQSGVLTIISADTVNALYNKYNTLSQYERNSYTFTNGVTDISTYSGIQQQIFPAPQTPHTAYGIPLACIWLLHLNRDDSTFHLSVAFTDTLDVAFQVNSTFKIDDSIHVWVSYNHHIRGVFYTLAYSTTDQTRRQSVAIMSLKPQEEYILVNNTGVWKIQEVK